jgi:hypothetical protein
VFYTDTLFILFFYFRCSLFGLGLTVRLIQNIYLNM